MPALAGGVQTLDAVEVTASAQGLVGVAGTASEGTVTAKQLENRPLLRPGEVLEAVPGLIVSQHSGDGKANQYYLRGFNLDHGTDFATTLMGMPLNLPTHGHGQGYSDVQFLIPELIDRMQYRKGPYAAETGDFATAGAVSIDYLRRLPASFAELGFGEHGYQRALLAGSPAWGNGHLLYALEWTANNGPWQMAENLGKLNALLRYSQGSSDDGWAITAMAYRAQWASTDQVPQRAISSGLIGPYGNLDPSDGGRTSRASLSSEWAQRGDNQWTRANAYVVDYRLNLWSDFTFCINDQVLNGNCNRGDQFEQADQRRIYGANAARTWYGEWGGRASELTLGVQSRYDDIGNVGLYLTSNRQRWATVRQDKVGEGSIGLYGEYLTQWNPWLRSIVGLRGDFYRFDVNSALAANSGKVNDHLVSPKLALVFGPWAATEFYLNAGYGFHSNDARGVTAKLNPDFRDPATYLSPLPGATPLVRAKGYELGVRSGWLPGLQSSLALWRLDLDSELVFDGNAGTTAPSFPSRRTGLEWANYWTPTPDWLIDADFAWSRARYREVDASVPGAYIPGAIERAASIGVSYENKAQLRHWFAGARLRYFGPRPLIEDNSIRSYSSTLTNLRAGLQIDRQNRVALEVLNLFDRRASDIDYYYASQLKGEAAPVDDLHTHPAEPRTLRLSWRHQF